MKKDIKELASKKGVIPWEVKSEPRELPYSVIEFQVKSLMGEVLTVVDAALPMGEQKKAIKDLIKDRFSAKLSWLYEICGYPILKGSQISVEETEKSN